MEEVREESIKEAYALFGLASTLMHMLSDETGKPLKKWYSKAKSAYSVKVNKSSWSTSTSSTE
jgi:hypothetical protein